MQVFGYSPRAFHAANIALHVLNASLLFVIAGRVLGQVSAAFAAALFFALLPGILGAIAWVSAVTALLMTTWYLTAVLTHLAWLETGSRMARAGSVIAFAAALLTHEGAVTLLPMLIAAEYLVSSAQRPALRDLPRRYAPFAIALAAYLTIAFVVNRGNYVVTERQYRFGLHAIQNVFDYVATLYVGRRGTTGAVTTGVALLAVMFAGTRGARFGAVWMLVALVPYSLFTWTGIGRYAYLSGIGLSLLLAALVQSAARTLRPRVGTRVAAVAVCLLVAVLAGRFAVFAVRASENQVAQGEPYRAWLETFRQTQGTLQRGAVVTIDQPRAPGVDARALLPLLQLEYGDPALQVDVRPAPGQSAP